MAGKRKVGRPPKENIRKEHFESLCQLHCTVAEVCAWYMISNDKLSNWCMKTYGMSAEDCVAKFGLKGNVSLRRIQHEHAVKSPAMAIFLGKQFLGQSDNPNATEHEAEKVVIINDIPSSDVK